MVELVYLGHAFFKFALDSKNILVDPFIGCTTKGPDFKSLTKCKSIGKHLKDVSLILVTHEHFDHFDKQLIEKIAKRDHSLIVAHDSVLNELVIPKKQLCSVSSNSCIELRGCKIKVFPAHHPQSFYPLSYLLEEENTKLFHAGDTDLTESFDGIKADIAMLPIGGTVTMDIVDAVKVTKTMKPKIVVPMHYNTFKMIKADPLEFKNKIEKSNLKTRVEIMKPGQSLRF